jgi:hypothetical protein
MSYRTYSIIIKEDKDKLSELKQIMNDNFKFHHVREIYTPFTGIVCQSNETFKKVSFEKFSDNFFKNQQEVQDFYEIETQNNLIKFSKKYSEKQIAFIDVDCYGGKCNSEGFVLKNGIKIFDQEINHSGHKIILQKIDAEFNTWFFYPFTRTFFGDKGGINGDILDFTFAVIYMTINADFGNDKNFTINGAENELLLLKENSFELYFMKISDKWIKINGILFNNDKETIEYLKKLLVETFSGLEYNFNIDDFETGETINISSISNEKKIEVTSKSYRINAFNERKFEYPNSNINDRNVNNNSNSFWVKVKNILRGK